MTKTRFLVEGMTCQHCVNSVTAEVSAVANVTGLQIDLGSGIVTVDSDGILNTAFVHDAISAAGYTSQPA